MRVLTSLDAQFSVKGGGHTAFAGGSNAPDGVTIDLQHLNNVSVSADRGTVSLGPGGRWINVSSVLDPLGLAVVAGRVADVGVSGLILGGGISYFSGQRGWACDNVRRYEVVLASGAIVTASPTDNSDLYWALRGGGGSNFGIVTRFDVVAFEQGDLWMNELIFPAALNTTIYPMLSDLTIHGLPADPAAHTFVVMTYEATLGGYIILAGQYHSTIPATNTTPEVFQPMAAVRPTLVQETVVANISTLSKAIDEPYGSRHTWWTTTVKATSGQLLLDIIPIFKAHADKLLAAANGSAMAPFLPMQPIPSNILTAMQSNGGNALGLDPEDGPLMLIQVSTMWEDPALDDLVESSSKATIDKINELAESRSRGTGFVYMNYAGETQDVFLSYGTKNQERLRAVAQKWDPEGKLQKLWRGYFKLG
jgi:hypothetical protein